MVAAIAKWKTASGIRRTSPTDTLRVSVEAWTSVGGGSEGGVNRVEFSTVVNGGAPTVTSVMAPTYHKPNYSDRTSFLPGVSSGMAPIFAYLHTLDCGALAAGTIVVTATVYSTAGTATALPGSITLYNDKDGVDRRPSNKVIYCSPTGSNANNGLTSGAPKLTLMASIEAAVANRAGSTSADFDAGGAKVIMMVGDHEWAGGTWSTSDWHTSGNWWLTVEFEPGATITSAPNYPERYLICPGYSGAGSCRIRFVGGQWLKSGGGVVSVGASILAEMWVDGVESGSPHWSPGMCSVRYAETQSELITFDGPGAANGKRRMSCGRIRGVTTACHGWTSLNDVVIEDWIAVALQSVGSEDGHDFGNILFGKQAYTNGVIGWANVTAGALLTVSIPADGQMRIEATGAVSMDFAAGFNGLIGSTFFGVGCLGFTSGDNNGTFLVLSTGTTGGGNPYVVVANPSAVAEVGGAGAQVITSVMSNGHTYENDYHTDGWQQNATRTDCLYSNIAFTDEHDTVAWYTTGNNSIRCAWINCTNGGQDLRNNFTAASFTDCLFFFCTFQGHTDFTTSGETYTRSQAVDCVFRETSDFPTFAFTSHCHFVTGPTYGASASSGSWLLADPTVYPWSLQPAGANLNTASGLLPAPVEWRWPGASATSRGCWRNVGLSLWDDGIVPGMTTVQIGQVSFEKGPLDNIPSLPVNSVPETFTTSASVQVTTQTVTKVNSISVRTTAWRVAVSNGTTGVYVCEFIGGNPANLAAMLALGAVMIPPNTVQLFRCRKEGYKLAVIDVP